MLRRPYWSSSIVLPVSQWCYDKSPGVTEILVAVEEFRVHCPDVEVISHPVISTNTWHTHTHTQYIISYVTCIIVLYHNTKHESFPPPTYTNKYVLGISWPELADPLKVVNAGHGFLHQFGSYVFSMYLDHDESRENSSLHSRQTASHQLHQVSQLPTYSTNTHTYKQPSTHGYTHTYKKKTLRYRQTLFNSISFALISLVVVFSLSSHTKLEPDSHHTCVWSWGYKRPARSPLSKDSETSAVQKVWHPAITTCPGHDSTHLVRGSYAKKIRGLRPNSFKHLNIKNTRIQMEREELQ